MQKKEKNCETHAYAKKYEKHNDAKKGKWETHDYKKKLRLSKQISKKRAIMQKQRRKQHTDIYICRANKNKQNRK